MATHLVDDRGVKHELIPEEIDRLRHLTDDMVVTKIVCTRTVKGKFGDTFVGFSAGWCSVQDDNGGSVMEPTGGEEMDGIASGWTLKEAALKACILQRKVDIQAFENASDGGNCQPGFAANMIKGIKGRYNGRLVAHLRNGSGK
jgi:hypothetical protein